MYYHDPMDAAARTWDRRTAEVHNLPPGIWAPIGDDRWIHVEHPTQADWVDCVDTTQWTDKDRVLIGMGEATYTKFRLTPKGTRIPS